MCTDPLHVPLFMSNFAQRLKELRTARNLTQTRLAELMTISPRVPTPDAEQRWLFREAG